MLVDEDVDVRDRRAVFGAIRDHFDPAEDFLLLPGVPLDTLDFTSMRMNLGSKMVLDATGRRGVGPGDARRRPARAVGARAGELDAERLEQARARRDVAARELAGRLPGAARGARRRGRAARRSRCAPRSTAARRSRP